MLFSPILLSSTLRAGATKASAFKIVFQKEKADSLRERRWFGIEEALSLIGRKEIQPMIAKLGRMLGAKSKTDGQ